MRGAQVNHASIEMYVKSSNFAGWLHIDQYKVALCVMYQQKVPAQLFQKKLKKQGVKFADFSQNPFPWQHAKIDTWRPLWGPELQSSHHHSTTAIYCLNWVPTMPNSIQIFI